MMEHRKIQQIRGWLLPRFREICDECSSGFTRVRVRCASRGVISSAQDGLFLSASLYLRRAECDNDDTLVNLYRAIESPKRTVAKISINSDIGASVSSRRNIHGSYRDVLALCVFRIAEYRYSEKIFIHPYTGARLDRISPRRARATAGISTRSRLARFTCTITCGPPYPFT